MYILISDDYDGTLSNKCSLTFNKSDFKKQIYLFKNIFI